MFYFWDMKLEKDQANPAHPLSKFATGNKKTLETDTLARGIDVRDELLKFHKRFFFTLEQNFHLRCFLTNEIIYHFRYYSSNQMTLCVSGTQNLDTLEKWVTTKFSKIPNRGGDSPESQWWGQIRPYEVQQVATELQIVPISESLRYIAHIRMLSAFLFTVSLN